MNGNYQKIKITEVPVSPANKSYNGTQIKNKLPDYHIGQLLPYTQVIANAHTPKGYRYQFA